MKRIICIILALITLVTFLIVPASATENDSAVPYQPTFIDLMERDFEYDRVSFSNGSEVTREYTRDPVINFKGSYTSVALEWGTTKDKYSCNYVYVSVVSPYALSSVVWGFNNTVGTLVATDDDLYIYRFNINGTYSGLFRVTINVSSSFRGNVSLASVYAMNDYNDSIDSVNFRVQGQFVSDGQYYLNTIDNISATFPYSWRKDYNIDSPSSSPDKVFWDISFNMPVPYADSISFTFSSPNTIAGPYQEESFTESTGVQIYDGSGTQMILPYVVSSVPALTGVSGHFSYIHTITVDISGVDFNNGDKLCFRFYMWRMYTHYDSSNRANFYSVQLLSLSYQNTIHTKPWYVRFFYWLQQEFNDLITSFSGFFTNLQNFFTTKFSSLETTIKNALGVGQATPDISDQQQGMQDSADDMDSASDEIGSSREELDELMPSMPSWEDTGLDGFDDIVGAFIQEIRVIFLAIYANSIINQILAYTFLFALGGFILFGER